MISELLAGRFSPKQIGQLVARATGLGSMAVAQTEQPYLEKTRAGRRFSGIGVAAGAAPVQAIPTTTATHLLYNPDKNVSYEVDTISAYLLSATVATAGLSIFAIVTPITATLPTAAAGSLIGSNSYGNRLSKAIFATAYTIPTPAGVNQWGVVGSGIGGVPGVGGGATFEVQGKIVVPPGFALGLAVMAGAGTAPLYVPTVTWTETELDLE